ncbi:MAG: CehA/McbA family metallohydrolase [Sphingomonas sp.]
MRILFQLGLAVLALGTTPAAAQNVYFGTTHAHTSYSDGSGTPAEAYAMAEQAGMDFLAITEHNHDAADGSGDREKGLLIATQPTLYAGPPRSLIATANRVTRNDRFVALYGQEFSTISSGNHVNVFDVGSVIDSANGKYDQLVSWLGTNRDSSGSTALVQFNHPGIDKPELEYGRDDFGGDDRRWVAAVDPIVELIEVLNAPALKPGTGFRSSRDEANYFRFLNLGFHVAPTAGHDNHYRNWGKSTDARTAVIASRLTKVDLIAAMRARHVYATEDKNLKIVFRANGALSGDIIAPPAIGSELILTLELSDADEPNAEYQVDVFQDRPGGDQARRPVETYRFEGNSPAPHRLEGIRFGGPGEYVLVRVTQFGSGEHGDNDRAWTAPVWLEFQAPSPVIPPAALPAVRIASLIPNPAGDDVTNEEITLRNVGSQPVALQGWQVRDLSGRTWSLDAAGTLPPGQEITIRREGQEMALNNDGDTVELLDASGAVVQSFAYANVSQGQAVTPP